MGAVTGIFRILAPECKRPLTIPQGMMEREGNLLLNVLWSYVEGLLGCQTHVPARDACQCLEPKR